MIQFNTFVSRRDNRGRLYAVRSRTTAALSAIMSGDADEVRASHHGFIHASLSKKDGRYVMSSPLTGEHSLDAASTDMKRLAAHWRGFLKSQWDRMG